MFDAQDVIISKNQNIMEKKMRVVYNLCWCWTVLVNICGTGYFNILVTKFGRSIIHRDETSMYGHNTACY